MNNKIQDGKVLVLAPSGGAAAGAPVLVGGIKGIPIDTIASGSAGPCMTEGVFDLSVAAVNDSGNTTIAIGDKLYYTAGDTPKINKKASGTFWGYALEANAVSGSTATINVKLESAGNLVSPAAGAVATGYVCILAGKHTTAGGDANEAITATGAVATDIALVTMQTQGTGSRTILSAVPATDAINVVLSGDPSTNHIIAWAIFRAVA